MLSGPLYSPVNEKKLNDLDIKFTHRVLFKTDNTNAGSLGSIYHMTLKRSQMKIEIFALDMYIPQPFYNDKLN